MSILSSADRAKYALAHGCLFAYSCDTPDCGKLIRESELCIVLKWMKRTDGLQSMLGRIPSKVRCMTCEHELHPPKEEVKIKNAGRGVKKVSVEVAKTIQINEIVRKIIMRTLKMHPEGLPVKTFLASLRKKKVIRELSPKEVRTTFKCMKKLKMFRRSKGLLMLPKEKKAKKKVSQ